MNGVPLFPPAPTPAFLVGPASAAGKSDTSPTIRSGLALRTRPKSVPKPHWGRSRPHQPTTVQDEDNASARFGPAILIVHHF
jgi:hypothetical protein